MRPKRRLIVWYEDEVEGAPIAYALRLGTDYRIQAATNDTELGTLLAHWEPAGIVALRSAPVSPFVAEALRGARVPLLVVGEPEVELGVEACRDFWLMRMPAAGGVLGILERLKILTTKKRGPRKGAGRLKIPEAAATPQEPNG